MSKLRQAMIDAMLVRGFAVRTHQSYLSTVADLSKYYDRSPVRLSTSEIQDYFLYLVKERHLSPASCRLSLNGIRFLYQEVLHREFEAKIQIPKRSQRIPELLTGVDKVGGIHSLRHAYATHQLVAGMPITQLQHQMGHKDIRTTLRYVHWVPTYQGGDSSTDLIADLEVDHEWKK
jgi:site-specific recombinase XerD